MASKSASSPSAADQGVVISSTSKKYLPLLRKVGNKEHKEWESLAQYREQLEKLGSGHFATVYLVKEKEGGQHPGRMAACKVIEKPAPYEKGHELLELFFAAPFFC